MAIIWPPSLPQKPLNDSYIAVTGSTLVRTSMDVGPAKVRRRQSRAVDLLSVSFVMTLEQISVFEGFVSDVLNDGVRTFEFPRACGGGAYIVRIVPLSNDGLYQISTESNYYKVTLTLEIMP